MTDADLREAVARAMALRSFYNDAEQWPHYGDDADAAIALVVARCAEVADECFWDERDVSAAIRALAPQEPSHER